MQRMENGTRAFVSPGFVSTLGSPRPVAGAAERLRHTLLRARQDVAAGAHGAPDDHRLPRELVVDGDEGVVRGERAGGALAVDQQRLEIAVHDVLLHLPRRGGVGGGCVHGMRYNIGEKQGKKWVPGAPCTKRGAKV